MQLRRMGTAREGDKTFDFYVYCDDDGEPVYSEDSHPLMKVASGQAFMAAESKLAPSETQIVSNHTADGRAHWRLLSKTQAEFNNASDTIPIGEPE